MRFEIEQLAGAGGMGTVYRARDLDTGEPVAFKVLQRHGADELLRFSREARLLAELRHPAVVRYVAHGATDEGRPYLVMEWLEGEDLGERLARVGLTIRESTELLRRVAGALVEVHSRGVVHRDIKPSNLFLPGRDIAEVKLLDFGIARLEYTTHPQTRTGMGLGTPGYMAPEQARGARDVDARADLFSLGCVLFEVLTGQPAFAGEHVMAVLAKVLFEEAPRLRELRREMPQALEALVEQLLRKEPGERPESAAEVVAALEAVEELAPLDTLRPVRQPTSATLTRSPSAPALTRAEQRLVSVLLIGGAQPRDVDRLAADRSSGGTATQSTLQAIWYDEERALQRVVRAHSGRYDRLADGTWVVTLSGSDAATDQAARAARCVLALRAALPGQPSALSTGRGTMEARGPVGAVIDRAARLLQSARAAQPAGDKAPIDRNVHWPVRIDALTAGLLDPRFLVDIEEGELLLLGEADEADEARTLLGKRTPCIGRERELRVLEGLFEECASEPMARAVLVTGPAGIGKSRVRQELLHRLRERDRQAEIWIARGDPMSRGSPFNLLGQALRCAAGIERGDDPETRARKLKQRVMKHVPAAHCLHVTEFLGELLGASPAATTRLQLDSARENPVLIGDQMRLAWDSFLTAECEAHPVVLVFEDLHWGDVPTVKFVDTALRNLAERPLLVVAFARPEVTQLFPELWMARGAHAIGLSGISRRAGEQLVHEVLGDAVPKDRRKQLVERANGNAFFLEELIRSEALGQSDAPETVLAMVQSRVESLPEAGRHVLRAASVFGDTFTADAVAALLGGQQTASELSANIADLHERELLTQHATGSSQPASTYRFRHDLLRDAAYAMLTDEDRTLGHRLAGEWLESHGETEALALAEHFERGAAPARAVRWHHQAAKEALAGNALAEVVSRAARGVACGASGERLGALRLLQSTAHNWRGEFVEAKQRAEEAQGHLRPGSALWFDAAERLAWATETLGRGEDIEDLIALLRGVDPAPDATGAWLVAWAALAEKLISFGEKGRAEELLAQVELWEQQVTVRDSAVTARIRVARAFCALVSGDLGEHLRCLSAAIGLYEEAGYLRNAILHQVNVGYAYIQLGAFSDAERMLRSGLATAERMEARLTAAYARRFLALSLAPQGRLEEARRHMSEAAEALQTSVNVYPAARMELASILLLEGDLEGAEAIARAAVETASGMPAVRPVAQATLASVLLARGANQEAMVVGNEAAHALREVGSTPMGEALVHLTHAELLHATSDHAAACAVITSARRRLLERAAGIREPEWRECFLKNVPENRRTLELARAWLGEGASAALDAEVPGGRSAPR